jgi:tetraacyldisaccharide 4'-kinase
VLTTTPRARLERAWREGLPAPWDTMLAGAALAYRGALALREAAYAAGLRKTRTLPCRVVAVGNLTVGGTGKTPLVELIARRLQAGASRVVVLSRGYRRRPGDTVHVIADGERVRATPSEAGDEAYLLAHRLPGVPVVVGRDRFRAGAAALARFAPHVLLLDDGFQQRRLGVDVAIVCLDARAPWGPRGLFPRGSLRERPAALARADLLVLTHSARGADLRDVEDAVRAFAPSAPIARAVYEVEGVEDARDGTAVPLDALRARPLLAFAGIAAPENFRATLTELGVRPRAFVAFGDHHAYRPADLADLEARARAAGAEVLLTTEKDAVRLPAGGAPATWVLRVRLRLREEDAAWWAALDARLAR